MISEHRKFIYDKSGALYESMGSIGVMVGIGRRSHLIALHFAI